MARTGELVDRLKRELRARNITYAAVAKRLGMSEASVKRMFSRKEFTLSRLDAICEVAGMEFSDLARGLAAQDAVISQLTYEQEKEFVENHRLMAVALATLNHWTFDEIVAFYDIDPPECTRLLARLDRLKFIELMPNNRIRLLVSRAFTWIPDGPIQRFFKAHGSGDFFASSFDGEDELLVLNNGALSRSSVSALLARLRKTAAEFSGMRSDDASLPLTERAPITLLLAARPWFPAFLRKHRRQRPASSAAALATSRKQAA
ncbi:MAG TPA: helix-turn-helix transcriptional regulator [Burkholderiales bacterium]